MVYMIENFKEQILGPVDLEAFSTIITEGINKPLTYGAYDITKAEVVIMHQASDSIIGSLPKDPVIADILKAPKFEEAVRAAAGDLDTKTIRTLASILFDLYAYELTCLRTDSIQTDSPNEEYEKIALAAEAAQETIDDYVLIAVGKMIHTVCPDARGSLTPEEKKGSRGYFSDVEDGE